MPHSTSSHAALGTAPTPPNGPLARLRKLAARRPQVGTEMLAFAASAYFGVVTNAGFWRAALPGDAPHPGHAAVLAVLLVGVQALALLLVLTRRNAKPLLALLFVVAAVAAHAGAHYGVYLDPSMLRNALKTDFPEARELLTPALAADLLVYAGPALLALLLVRLERRSWPRTLRRRGLALLACATLCVGALLADFSHLASLMRNHKALRYQVAPANVLYSGVRALLSDGVRAPAVRTPIGTDARLGPAWSHSTRPVLFVMVVGETARSANWGLSGYTRQTTPELARRTPIAWPRVDTCGTDTETSVPCIFARLGRRDYDESRIRREQSLLHVAARAGLGVEWIDNQSGCKGVCDGLPSRQVRPADHPGLCDGERCLDDALTLELDRSVAAMQAAAGGPTAAPASRLIVLHMLGNHGPAYWRRYPADQAAYTPDCRSDDLSSCSREAIVNAYDNALRHTDRVLATTLDRLAALSSTHDVALLFVSDHGESLGEKGLYLHGMPYAIAPQEQTQVPMLLWLSDGYAQRFGVDRDCLERQVATAAPSHDHLFPTLLGLLDVRTALHDERLDLAAGCRR